MSNKSVYKKFSVLFVLLFLLGLSACGPKASSSAPASSGSSVSITGLSNKPIGIGTKPEPGNDGKPAPSPDGHGQSIVSANAIVYVGSDNGILYALNASNGVVRWQQKIGTFVTVSAVMNGNVYVATDSTILAFDALSGARRWQHQVGTLVGSQVMMFSDGTLFVSTVASNNHAYTIYAFKTNDGSQIWQYTTMAVTPTLSGVVNGIVYSTETTGDFVQGDQHLTAIRASDGHVLWRVHVENTAGMLQGAPISFNGVIYITTNNGTVYALQTTTGRTLWSAVSLIKNIRPAIGDNPAVLVAGVLYVTTAQGTSALRASDGSLIWKKQSRFLQIHFLTPPVVNNGRVYVTDNGQDISALRVQDGSQIWQYSKNGAYGSVTVVDGLIQVDTSSKVYALHEQDGSLAWQQSFDHHNGFSSRSTSTLVAAGIVYVSEDSGVVHALHSNDGKPLWSYAIQETPEPIGFVYYASVSFATSVSYQQALKIITDLGLQMSLFCPSMWKTPQANGDFSHFLSVRANVNSAPLWLERLKTTPGVKDTQLIGGHSCPMERLNDDFSVLHLKQDGTFVQVKFSPTVSYNNALQSVSDLWFRVADPCYEQARAQGKKPTWHNQGQVATFAQTHSFILATTTLNSIHWLDQLHAVTGVVKVDAPLKMTC